MDNGIQDEVQHCYHATDEEEWQERLEVPQALPHQDTHEAWGVRNKPQRLSQHILFRSCRAMGLFKWRETLSAEAYE